MSSTASPRPARLHRLLGGVAAVGVALMAAIGPALPAAAHDSLVAATPAPDSQVAELTQVRLEYSGTLLSIGEDQRSAAIQVVHDGRYFETGCPKLVDNTASVEVAAGSAGEYEVRWQVVSSDGHTISGTYTVDYEPAEGTTDEQGADSPACAQASNSGETEQPSDDSILIGAAGGIVGLAVIGVVIAVLVGRRRSSDDRRAGEGGDGGAASGASGHDGDSGSKGAGSGDGGDGGGGGGGD